jgi:hypothetical protein
MLDTVRLGIEGCAIELILILFAGNGLPASRDKVKEPIELQRMDLLVHKRESIWTEAIYNASLSNCVCSGWNFTRLAHFAQRR